ncbi:hypothetical protein JGS6364_15911 [[Clostridium] sordellii]|uniref:Membrane protein n=1 Tax=Paraclostridium sordellii TaxID=1505 RepID=A0A0A1S3T5_PARSO|nr:hypothetical protein [Paeniclostridium sordellii]EPZ55443.1 putative membrane protein [[Clostridium] sordellii ATCC 9714] [Paeniclostridium sordellii ATCC 9714]MDU5021946.1 hypothetical protein [Clostridiales bacterium]AUN13417.1 hypothetical protein RSJ16_03950 [Paeniclostridium sordellii]MBS6024952.1 hypothetical protein [Paeniclostridium sordellii]MBX9180597.1 hypothetical protein [Paeniclostridium sordellii]
MATKSRSYNILKLKRWNIQLVMHFTMLLIFFFLTQLGAVLIGFTYLEGNISLQFAGLIIANFIFYKVMTGMNLL